MRKTIAAATVGASLAVGGLAGSALGGPGVADAANRVAAQDTTDTTDSDTTDGRDGAGWVADALSGLVEDGTLTQEQADAVEDALADARPHGAFGDDHHRGGGWHAGLSTVAEALGVSEDDLRGALEDGQTIAEVAEEQGVEVQDVVDAVVAAQQERLDEAVADGDLTQEEADEIAADVEERVTAFVNGEMPPLGDGMGHGPGPGGHGRWGGDGPSGERDAGDAGDADDSTGSGDSGESSDTTDTTT